jgi:C4-dicarboxylate transporter, DctQ subunit
MRTLFFARLSQRVQRVEEGILTFGILVIAGVTIVNVFCRTVLSASLVFAEELAQFCIILVTFVGLGYAAGKGRHIRMSALYDQLGQRARKVLMVLIAGATAMLMFVMAYYSLCYIATVYALGTASPALQVPFALVYLAAPLGFVLAGIQYGLAVARNLLEDEVYLSYEHKDEYAEEPEHAV